MALFEPDRLPQDRLDLAQGLRALRRAAGLSGERLAVRCGMSQTKISRFETGKAAPTVAEVERLLTALDTPQGIKERFLDLARIASVGYKSVRAYAETGLWRAQDDIAALIASSTVVRQFMPAIPSGLLQTADYARYVLTPAMPGDVAWDADKAVTARLKSQATLHDPVRTFRFLLLEQAIRWPRAPRDVLAAQCRHIAELSRLSTVDVMVVPRTAVVSASPMNFFVIYDERLVGVELFSGSIVFRDPKDVSYHGSVFDHFAAHAVKSNQARTLLHAVADEFMRKRD